MRYEFRTSYAKSSDGNGDSSVLIPVGPTVKITLRPEIQERWRSYIATNWDDWHNYLYWAYLKERDPRRYSRAPWVLQMFEDHKRRGKARLSRSARASFSRGYKLVVVQGYVKAASYAAVATRDSCQLSVEFEVPSLNWFRHDQLGGYRHLEVSITPTWSSHSGLWRIPGIRKTFSCGFRTIPATSPGNVAFSPKRSYHSAMCYVDTPVVRTINSQLNEHGRGLQVTETLFYHTIAMGPNVPLLGNLGVWFKKLPSQERPSQRSLYVRAIKLCKQKVQLLRGVDGGREDDDARGKTDWLMKNDS